MDVTSLLQEWQDGDKDAFERLVPIVYRELQILARHHLSPERQDHTLGTAGLINEAYIRLRNQKELYWENRAQFYGFATKVMRRVLLDYAREKAASKRGGDQVFIPLENAEEPAISYDFEALEDALRELEQLDPRQARVVELKFYAGLKAEEIAKVLDVAPITVHREWRLAKAWLFRKVKRVAP